MEKPLEWVEAAPLPDECRNCKEAECYNCDYEGKRWYLSEEDSLRLQKKGLRHTIDRLEQKIHAIEDPNSEIRKKAEADLLWYKQVLLEDCGELA